MKAVRLHKYHERPTVEQVPEPTITDPHDVVVRIGGAGLCRTDLHIYEGQWAERSGVELPYTIGHENAGWVEEVGSAVTNVATGDTVILHPLATCGLCRGCRAGDDMHCELGRFPGIDSDGGMAELLKTSARATVKLDPSLQPADVAALADAGLTAYHAVKKAVPSLYPGTKVVVIGAGGLGHIGIQSLKALTPAEIIVVDRSEPALELARSYGADHTVTATGDQVERVTELTGGKGAEVVIDFVGERGAEVDGWNMTRRAGSHYIIGYQGEAAHQRLPAGRGQRRHGRPGRRPPPGPRHPRPLLSPRPTGPPHPRRRAVPCRSRTAPAEGAVAATAAGSPAGALGRHQAVDLSGVERQLDEVIAAVQLAHHRRDLLEQRGELAEALADPGGVGGHLPGGRGRGADPQRGQRETPAGQVDGDEVGRARPALAGRRVTAPAAVEEAELGWEGPRQPQAVRERVPHEVGLEAAVPDRLCLLGAGAVQAVDPGGDRRGQLAGGGARLDQGARVDREQGLGRVRMEVDHLDARLERAEVGPADLRDGLEQLADLGELRGQHVGDRRVPAIVGPHPLSLLLRRRPKRARTKRSAS